MEVSSDITLATLRTVFTAATQFLEQNRGIFFVFQEDAQ